MQVAVSNKAEFDDQIMLSSLQSGYNLSPSMNSVSIYGEGNSSSEHLPHGYHGHSHSISSESGSSASGTSAQGNFSPLEYPPRQLSPGLQNTMLMVPPRRNTTLNVSRRPLSYSDEEEDEPLSPLPDDATEEQRAIWKRKQNTLSARRSRKRKQQHVQKLENEVIRLKKEKDMWKERALTMERMISSQGLPVPRFDARN